MASSLILFPLKGYNQNTFHLTKLIYFIKFEYNFKIFRRKFIFVEFLKFKNLRLRNILVDKKLVRIP
jgi:hypothetical protein